MQSLGDRMKDIVIEIPMYCGKCGKPFYSFHVCDDIIREQVKLITEEEDKIFLSSLLDYPDKNN